MSTSNKKIVNKASTDPIEKLIYEHGLRITHVVALKKQDMLIAFLNNSVTVPVKLSSFPLLKKANKTQLDEWKLISKGIGIEWPQLDEDISLKGLIKELILMNTLKFVKGEYSNSLAA